MLYKFICQFKNKADKFNKNVFQISGSAASKSILPNNKYILRLANSIVSEPNHVFYDEFVLLPLSAV